MTAVLLGLALVVAGGVAALWPGRLGERVFALGVVAGCAVGATAAVRVLLGTPAAELRLAGAIAGAPWVFGLDRLSAAFLVVFLAVGAAGAVYGVTYLAADRGHRPVRAAHLLTAILIASLALVATARAVVPFLVAWEGMALSAYLLVMFESDRPETRRAGLLYLVVTHAGTLALVLMFALWGTRAPDLTFAALGTTPVPAAAGGALLVLALIGFGAKAGIVPLHFWLPAAHAAAPSHVSALMSGIVIKTGIYGLLRVSELLGPPPPWWGWTVLALGLASGVLGVVWALAQHDLKRLLAYHSVENIGIILLGLGAGALGSVYGAPLIAVLGYGGAVLHVLNHALFKSLLFMGAGAVVRATGTRRIDRLGGLARAMPVTWLTFLVASAAIVGLPPLNGFVSEWVVFQSLFRGAGAEGPLRLTVFATAGLGLIGALALACFAKVSGVIFLGRARSVEADAAREVGGGMLGPMTMIAVLCIAIGFLPHLLVPVALRVGAAVAGVPDIAALGGAADVGEAAGWIAVAALALSATVGAGWLLRAALLRGRPVATAETWACGYAAVTARMQYTASSFAAPVLAVYGRVSGLHTRRGASGLTTHATDPVLDAALVPLWTRVLAAVTRLQPLRRGRIHVSLLLFVGTLVLVLIYLAVAGEAP